MKWQNICIPVFIQPSHCYVMFIQLKRMTHVWKNAAIKILNYFYQHSMQWFSRKACCGKKHLFPSNWCENDYYRDADCCKLFEWANYLFVYVIFYSSRLNDTTCFQITSKNRKYLKPILLSCHFICFFSRDIVPTKNKPNHICNKLTRFTNLWWNFCLLVKKIEKNPIQIISKVQ